MKRRDFLKYLSSIPFVGSLVSGAESVTSGGQLKVPYVYGGRGWRFYINDEEVDSSLVENDDGSLHAPDCMKEGDKFIIREALE